MAGGICLSFQVGLNISQARAYFKTSIPASPNFRAANPIHGKAEMIMNGVQIFHFRGMFACIATRVANAA